MNSMTAFGRARHTGDLRDVTVEIRSVNNRFLDLSVRLPRTASYLEEAVKEAVSARGIRRGKVDVTVTVETHGAEACRVCPDLRLAASYVEALRALRDTLGLTDDITVSSVAENRDLFTYEKPEADEDALRDAVMVTLSEALDGFIARRATEGANTRADIAAKMQTVMAAAAEIKVLSGVHIRDIRARFEERMRALMGETLPDDTRLLTECALYADRLAIDEELARLDSHSQAFAAYLDSEEPVGRPLDFLLQEFNRETNTIGSKACHAEIARLVVRMKTELEKIREQIQNLE